MPGSIALFVLLFAAKTSTDGAELLVDVKSLDAPFAFDIRYATEDNFVGKKIYPEARCLIRKEVAPKLVKAASWLKANDPRHRLLFKDCYRPDSLQRVLWKAVRGTKMSAYVADPNTEEGSMHSYGAAVDVTLVDEKDKELDMGTPYDFLGPLAEPRREKEFHEAGKLSNHALANRRLLRKAMRAGGMVTIPNEWWHFDDAFKPIVRQKFKKLDVPFSAVQP
jgi:D-alanyl-D-alanine dipeptidase